MGVWHKFDGINTMAQKGAKAPNDTAPKARPAAKKAGGGNPFGGKRAAPFGKAKAMPADDGDGC